MIDLPEPGRHLVLIEATGTGVGSGIPISGRIAHLVTLDGGRIRQIDAFASWDQGLEAVGLSE